MADVKERLQPSLLDRLTDDEPGQQTESRDRKVLSPFRLRESVRRDLAWLFNTTNLASSLDLSNHPEVEQSTLNYGLPDLAGKSKSNIDVDTLERALRKAIWDYEPRLVRKSVRVKLVGDLDKVQHNNMRFNIEAELWAQPLPLRLFLRTELDLETGSAQITELTSADAD